VIIGLSGFIGTGKDATAHVLERRHGFVVVGLADPLKRIVREVYDFKADHVWGPSQLRGTPDERYPRPVSRGTDNPGEPFLTPRYALQTLGTEWGRDCYPDTWVSYALRTAETLLSSDGSRAWEYTGETGLHELDPALGPFYPLPGVVIPDCRFGNEFSRIRERGGKLVRIKRPGKEAPAFNHPSETEQLEYPDSFFDVVLLNDGAVEDLDARVASMLETLRSAA